jgi:methyl-accepting chemotaxis protein
MGRVTAAPDASAQPSEREAEDLRVAVDDVLRRALKQAVRRIADLNRLTESGVLSAGRSLDAIVGEAQAYTKDARATLEGFSGSSEQQGIAAVIASQNEVLENFMREIRAQVERQAEVARAAMLSSSQIQNLGNEIGSVAFQSRLLSLNASIEAGRMGAQGRAFGVIAAEMTKLSQQVESTSKAVSELVSVLSAALPNVAAAARQMQGTSEAFIAEIGGSIAEVDQKVRELGQSVQQTMHGGDRCVSHILRHSQDALSSLQFQDPVAQGLVAVAKDFNGASRGVVELLRASPSAARSVARETAAESRVFDKVTPGEAVEHVAVVAKASSSPPPGEVLLF